MNNKNMIRAISLDGGVVYCGVDSTDIVREAHRIHNTSAPASAALGRLLTAASMMGIMLKSASDTMTLRVNGGGPAGLLVVVTDGTGNVRGYMDHPEADVPDRTDGKLNVGALVGKDGTLSVVRDLGLKEPYIGMIPLVSGEIAEDVTSYYAVSEQIPTVCALGVLVGEDLSVQNAGGFLVQLLPGAPESDIDVLEANIAKIGSITQMMSRGMDISEIMGRVMQGLEPELLDDYHVEYKCTCSYERSENMLMSLSEEELRKLHEEEDTIKAECHFCGKVYSFSAEAILNKKLNIK